MQDGGTAPTGTLTGTGWTVAKLATPNFAALLCVSKRGSASFTTADAIGSFAASACFRSQNAFTGIFANTNWSLAFRLRASAAASSQSGSVNVRIWKSTNPDGTGATQLTSAVLTGTTTGSILTTASSTSTVTWTPPGTIALNNEYLWVQCEWSIVVASGSNSGDVLIYTESAGAITTPNFNPTLSPPAGTCNIDGGTVAPIAQIVNTDVPAAASLGLSSAAPTIAIGAVVLLLHFDGAAASTSFPDASGHSHAVTPAGAAQIDTAQSVFGGASGKFASSTDEITLDGSSDFSFATGDFTIEQWVRFDTLADYTVADWAPGPQIRIKSDGHAVYAIGGVDQITSAAALSINTPYHLAVTRAAGTTRLFINGAVEATTYVASDVIAVGASRPIFGGPAGLAAVTLRDGTTAVTLRDGTTAVTLSN